MSDHPEYNHLPRPDSMQAKETNQRGGTGNNFLLLLVAFGLGLLGLWLGNRYLAPPTGENSTVKSEDIVKLEQQIAALTGSQAETEGKLTKLMLRVENLESSASTKPTDINSAITSPSTNDTVNNQIESDLAKAETGLTQNQTWSDESEALLFNLEKDYAVRGLDSILNQRLRTTLERMYDRYIQSLVSLVATDPNAAAKKINQLQGKNNAVTPPKNYTLTQRQKTTINGLAQVVSGSYPMH